MGEKAMNSKEGKKRHMGGLGGGKEKGEVM